MPICRIRFTSGTNTTHKLTTCRTGRSKFLPGPLRVPVLILQIRFMCVIRTYGGKIWCTPSPGQKVKGQGHPGRSYLQCWPFAANGVSQLPGAAIRSLAVLFALIAASMTVIGQWVCTQDSKTRKLEHYLWSSVGSVSNQRCVDIRK